MKRWIERGVFLLAAAAMVIAAAAIPTRRVQEDTLPEVYVYRGYAAATDAPWSEKSLDFAVKRFSHLLEAYFPGSEHVYMSVIPDKAAFMETPEGYTPAGAQETADYLAQRLPVEIIDIAAANNDRTLIVFRDSFGSSLVPLLAGGYRTVYAVDIRYISTDALSRVTEFPEGADVLLLYSVAVLQNSITLK